MTLIENFYNQSKVQLKQKLLSLKLNGSKFAATLDEWTSMKNTRYININLHYSVEYNEIRYVNLGMVKIDGSCPADRMLFLVSICMVQKVVFAISFKNF